MPDLADDGELVEHIKRLEKTYTDRIFHQLYANAGNLLAWYNEPNQVRDAWLGKLATSPKAQSMTWNQVGEIVIVGLLHRCFPDWYPIGLPIGSETRLSSDDAIIHVDVKTHKEKDTDLDRAQGVRPEQISGDGTDSKIQDLKGELGDSAPKLPPFYVFGNILKVCLSLFVICVYKFDPEEYYQYLNRVQLFTVPNGLIRATKDYRDIWRAGKDRHRIRVNLPALAAHESWRWREFVYEPHGVVITH